MNGHTAMASAHLIFGGIDDAAASRILGENAKRLLDV